MKIKDFWNKKTTFEKIISIIGILISLAIIVLSIIQIIGVWDNAIYVYEPLMGILMLIQAIENWKTNRSLAYFSIFVAVFIFICTIFILYI